jgi:hypothetical protein
MASTYSTSLRLELMATGDQSGTWGDTTNTNLGTLLEQAITGVLSVSQGDAELTLTSTDGASDQARNAVVNLTGAMTSAQNVIVPTSEKVYLIKNSTTGGFPVTVKTSAGSGVAVAAGTSQWVYCDGTDVVQGLAGYAFTGSANTFTATQTITSTDAGAAVGPIIDLYRNSASPAANDILGQVLFNGKDSAGNVQEYGSIQSVIADPTSASEDSSLDFYVYSAGARTKVLSVGGTAPTPFCAGPGVMVNPAMQISQENGTASGTANGYYPVDQWAMYWDTSTGVFTVQQVASVTPLGSPNRIRCTITTADSSVAAGEFLTLTQNIEGNRVANFRYGSASAIQSILRFGTKFAAGTYSFALHNAAANRSYVDTFTITSADTDEYFYKVVPGDTTGTWQTGNGIGITFEVCLMAGSTYQGTTGWQSGLILNTSGTTNGAGTSGDVFELFDVDLYPDPSSTGVAPAWELPDYADTLWQCQRYYERISNAGSGADIIGAGWASAGDSAFVIWDFKQVKRSDPTITGDATASNVGVLFRGSSNTTFEYSSGDFINERSARILVNGGAGLNTGEGVAAYLRQASAWIAANSRM